MEYIDVGFNIRFLANARKVKPGEVRSYTYPATVERVVDGDTADLIIELTPEVRYRHSCRFFGINAPEHDTDAGKAAKAYLEALLPVGTVLTVQTKKDKLEKYGRVLGILILADGRIVNDMLVADGHALKWDGKGARPV